MSDNIAAQPETVVKTKKLFVPLLVRPLNEKSLQRPPFKFIQEVVKNITSETRLLADLYNSQELDTNRTLDKSAKIAFLQKLIVFLERELDNTIRLDVRAARIVAGLDPDKTNQMLQALAYVLMSKKTGKPIQYIISAQENSKQSKISNNNTTRGSISRQTIKVDNSDDTKRVSGSGNKNISAKRPQEIVRASPNNNDRKQTDIRPSSSRKSSQDSGHVEQNSTTKSYHKNSLADNKISARRNSSNIARQNDRESPLHSADNKTPSNKLVRPTTSSSKPPPRAITKEELVTTDTQLARSSLTRPDSVSKDSDRITSAIKSKNSGEMKLFDDDTSKKANNHGDQTTTDATLDNISFETQTGQDKITKSFVGEKVNNIEVIINKNELIKLMNYQDGLKKYDLKTNAGIWNAEHEPSANVKMNLNEQDSKNKSVNESTLMESSNRKSSNTDQSVRMQEQTDKMKQSLKILAQFITPANKAVNFIFEDFDAIITEYERYLDRLDENKKSTSQVVSQNKSQFKLPMSRLNDLEIKIEKAVEELNRLRTQLVQNDTNIRNKISHHVSSM